MTTTSADVFLEGDRSPLAVGGGREGTEKPFAVRCGRGEDALPANR